MNENYKIERNIRPPRVAIRFLQWFCPGDLIESIEGDLFQQFEIDLKEWGGQQAKRKFTVNVLRFFRPGIFLRNKFSVSLINTVMIGNYVKVAARNMSKKKLYAFINAFGLSIAIAFCILIYLFIKDEKSFDQFHQDRERILVITEKSFDRDAYEKGERESPYRSSMYLPAKLAEVMEAEIPEVESVTRFSGGDGIMRYQDKILKQSTAYADSGFFKVFSFRVVQGSVNRIFRNGNEAVLTEEVAKTYFGAEDPIGKVFEFDNGEKPYSFTVVAVVETPPANSSIDFKMILPLNKRPYFARNRESWGAFSYPTFVKIQANADLGNFQKNLSAVTSKYMGDRFKGWRERENIPDEYTVGEFESIKFIDLHLRTQLSWVRSSDPKYSYILGCIAVLILIIAAINYISLALTTSASRRVEVGIRKVVGARKSQLIYQFGFESIILAFISMIIGIGLVALFLPSFNDFTAKGIELSSSNFFQLVVVSVAISLIIGLLAGAYPSLFLSGFKPVTVLKGRFTSKLHAGFTKPLVVFQFALSAFLIISATIMYQQMKYVTTKDLGYEKDQIIVIPTNAGWSVQSDRAVERFRNKSRTEPDIKSVTGTSSSFNQGWSKYGFKVKDEVKTAFVYRVDPYYIDLLGITMKEGRNFDERIASDTNAVIVNEAMVKDMGWTDPLNEHLNWKEDTVGLGSKIIGVVKNYHFLSLEREIEPMFLSMDRQGSGYLTRMMVKLEAGNLPDKIARVKALWSELNPDKPFEYSFVDQDVAKQYDKYKRWMNIAGLSTVFAILIASLGLFGLAGVNAINKTKEIGIRKVMGAELMNIFVLLNKQYLWMALIAFAIATPFSWYIMNKWIADFKFRITIGWELFAVSMVAGLIVALLTVSYHGIKAALINPAETLKYE
jgi:putative ABC transport system permease protein